MGVIKKKALCLIKRAKCMWTTLWMMKVRNVADQRASILGRGSTLACVRLEGFP